MNTINLAVQGMSCDSCVKHVTQALQTVAGGAQTGWVAMAEYGCRSCLLSSLSSWH